MAAAADALTHSECTAHAAGPLLHFVHDRLMTAKLGQAHAHADDAHKDRRQLLRHPRAPRQRAARLCGPVPCMPNGTISASVTIPRRVCGAGHSVGASRNRPNAKIGPF
jgi:hypothetical protein